MPARGIFLKIYLCFWLAIFLVIAAQVGLDWVSRTGPFRDPPGREFFERTVVPTLMLYGNRAVEHTRSGDAKALEQSAEDLRKRSGMRVVVTDSAGGVLGPGVLAGEIGDIAKSARDSRSSQFSIAKHRALIALPLSGNDEKDYYVIADVPGFLFGSGPPHGRPGPPPDGHRGPPPPPAIFSPLFLVPPGDHPYSWIRILCTLLISGSLCYLLARYLTAPIVKLRNAARRFVDGDLSVRITDSKVKWKDEISSLNGDFNLIAERIEGLITQQQRLIRDISHELRSPLARLTIATELVRLKGSAVSGTVIDRIEKETAELNTMIGQVLDIARFQGGAEQPETTSLDLAGLVEEIVDDADFEASVRNCSVHLLDGHEPCIVNGNEDWLRRGIENVIRNALRYTREGTSVEVRLERVSEAGAGCARLSIRDHGDGVPDEDLPNLFRPFYRVSSSRDRKTGGTGLGLAITERAVKLHNGTVTAENAPGGGLEIAILIPRLS